MKKIRFVKEYRAIKLNTQNASSQTFKYREGDVLDEVLNEEAQWLIDNGFAEEVKESGWWKQKYCEKYFYIGHDGSVYNCVWINDLTDNARLKLGSVFKTEEAAMRCRDYWEAIATVRQDEGVLTPEQVNERIKNEDLAYHVGYMGNRGNGEVLCGGPIDFCECWMPVGVILFDSEAHVDRSLRKHPDEWKTILNYDWSKE